MEESSPKTYPLLGNLAQKYLSIPPTSVASERVHVFSAVGDLVSEQRFCLGPIYTPIGIHTTRPS